MSIDKEMMVQCPECGSELDCAETNPKSHDDTRDITSKKLCELTTEHVDLLYRSWLGVRRYNCRNKQCHWYGSGKDVINLARKERRMKDLPKERIDEIFDGAESQSDYVLGLYKEVIDDWDSVVQLGHWPEVSENTSLYLFEKAQNWDDEHNVDALSGGLWMNNGFSTNEDLPDWKASLDNVEIIRE